MVTTTRARLEHAAQVLDPELPWSRSRTSASCATSPRTTGRVHVQITPTYSGCPAMEVIRRRPRRALAAAGYRDVEVVEFVLSPAWTTDWITDAGPGEARRRRHRAARAAPAPGPVALRSRCAARSAAARHPRVEPVRLDRVQVAVGLPVLPRAVRPLQGAMSPDGPTRPRRPVFHPLRVAGVDELTDDAVAITFAVPAELRTSSPSPTASTSPSAAASDVRRSYSICHPALLAGVLRIGVKRIAGRRVLRGSSDRLRVGDELEVLPPLGRFTTARPGAAALRRRRRRLGHHPGALARRGAARDRAGQRSSRCSTPTGPPASVMFLDELADLKDRWPDRFHLVHVLSREVQDVRAAVRRLDADRLRGSSTA